MTTDGGEVDTQTGSVTYTEDYRLAVPTNTDTSKTFVGWYELPNGTGKQYTDAQGYSLEPWGDVTDKTLYPCWISVFSFELQTEGTYKDTYSVTATASVSRVTKVVVPETYNGKKVTIVEGYAFNRSGTLRTIEIPDTIELIYYSNAFEGCTSLTEVNIYETGHAVSPLVQLARRRSVLHERSCTGGQGACLCAAGAHGTLHHPFGCGVHRTERIHQYAP